MTTTMMLTINANDVDDGDDVDDVCDGDYNDDAVDDVDDDDDNDDDGLKTYDFKCVFDGAGQNLLFYLTDFESS